MVIKIAKTKEPKYENLHGTINIISNEKCLITVGYLPEERNTDSLPTVQIPYDQQWSRCISASHEMKNRRHIQNTVKI